MGQTSNGMIVRENVPLAPLTTLRVGGAARFLIEATTEEEAREATVFARERSLPLFIIGNGSNLLVPDAGADGVVLRTSFDTITVADAGDSVFVGAGAGAPWDAVVDAARGAFGIENLAGIPGTVGGAAVQNVGAYGGEFSRTFDHADVLDLASGEPVRIEAEAADFSYRSSVFKKRKNLLILNVVLRLPKRGAPILSYADVARAKDAGVPLSTPAEIAAAIRSIRSKKFPGQGDGGTAGSFFKNPALPKAAAEALRARFPELPAFPQEDGTVKVSLAWLLDHALGLKGYAQGPVRLFERQPLVIVASEGATATDVDAFANGIAKRVHDELGIAIEREVETFASVAQHGA